MNKQKIIFVFSLFLLTLGVASARWEEGLKMDSSIPRPEHPRPQLYRNSWINLNGDWSYRFDFALSGTVYLKLGTVYPFT
ncbi:MAG: hypothetical protein R6V00_03075 [Candidatus Aminicenantes bacterium]